MAVRAVSLYIDPRVGGQKFHLYCIQPCSPSQQTLYESSLYYTDEEADEIACGERATCDMSFLIASRIVRAIRRFIVSKIVEPYNIEDTISYEAIRVGRVED